LQLFSVCNIIAILGTKTYIKGHVIDLI